MPVPLLRLRGVLEDEAEDIRELLKAHNIDFYETPAGNWGISMPAIWLPDESELTRARDLVANYQAERARRVRAEHDELKQRGEHQTMLGEFRRNPYRFVGAIALIAVIVYFSTMPFVDLGE